MIVSGLAEGIDTAFESGLKACREQVSVRGHFCEPIFPDELLHWELRVERYLENLAVLRARSTSRGLVQPPQELSPELGLDYLSGLFSAVKSGCVRRNSRRTCARRLAPEQAETLKDARRGPVREIRQDLLYADRGALSPNVARRDIISPRRAIAPDS